MKASFNGARANLANAYNKVAGHAPVSKEQKADMDALRQAVGVLLMMYQEGDPDARDMSDTTLTEVKEPVEQDTWKVR